MKKTVLVLLTSLEMSSSVYGQANAGETSPKPATTNSVISDALHYYMNKYYFMSGNTNLISYPTFSSNATGVSSATNITYCGSSFNIPAGETVTVTGLEAYAYKGNTHVNQNVPIHLYLFKINSATGLPEQEPVDSVVTLVGPTTVTTLTLVDGNFTSTTSLSNRIMTGGFAVGIRNMSLASGDYANFIHTASTTQTNSTSAAATKYGEGKGFVMFNGIFYSTTNFTVYPGFGAGTDYEFMVAPRVAYEVQASHLLPPSVYASSEPTPLDTICTRTELTFTNTSSPFFENVQYNPNQFYRKWNTFSPFP